MDANVRRSIRFGVLAIGLLLASPPRTARGGDTVEMLNGQKFRGEVVRADDDRVVVRMRMRGGGGSLEMTLKTTDVFAITKKGAKTQILNARKIQSATATGPQRKRYTGPLAPLERVLEHHAGIYRRCSPAVVGITCKNDRHQFFGTGVCISPKGLILTLTSTVPSDAQNIKVYLQGGTVIEAEVVESVPEVEATLIKVPLGRLPYLAIGEAGRAVVGDVVYTMANPDSVIMKDGRPAFSVGVISGIYDVEGSREYSTYKGVVLETDASVNRGSDGGPVLDRYGRLIGVISLSFSDSRFMGTAIPVNVIRRKMRKFNLAYGHGGPASRPRDTGLVPELGSVEKVFRSAAARVVRSVVTVKVEHEDRGPRDLSLEEKKSDPRKAMRVQRERFVKGTNAPTTGVVMSRTGHVLTAYSNVSGSIGAISVVVPGGREIPATLVGYDQTLDIACLKAEAGGARLTPITLAGAKDLPAGTMVALVGRSEPQYDVTLNAGIVSATDRNDGRALQADFLTNYGNQGGPVITLDGNVVGIAAFLNPKSRWNQNSGVSVVTKSGRIREAWGDLVTGAKRKLKPVASLGITPTIGATDVPGARVERVQSGSAAEAAGLKPGDVIVEFAGTAITEWGQLVREIRRRAPGDEVEMKVRKRGSGPPQSVTVVLKERSRGGRR